MQQLHNYQNIRKLEVWGPSGPWLLSEAVCLYTRCVYEWWMYAGCRYVWSMYLWCMNVWCMSKMGTDGRTNRRTDCWILGVGWIYNYIAAKKVIENTLGLLTFCARATKLLESKKTKKIKFCDMKMNTTSAKLTRRGKKWCKNKPGLQVLSAKVSEFIKYMNNKTKYKILRLWKFI